VGRFEISRTVLEQGVTTLSLLAEKTAVFPSKGELRRMIRNNGVSVNKEKIKNENDLVTMADVLKGKYVLIQKGKKNYYIIEAV
jgi:tyrosyl-tRNA synthetase